MNRNQLQCITTPLRYFADPDTEDRRCGFCGDRKTLVSLPSRHGIELDFFFHGYRIKDITMQNNLNRKDLTLVDFSKI